MAVNLNINVDVLKIADAIASAVNPNQGRDGFVKNLMETSFHNAGRRYNVMVFNLSQGYKYKFKSIVFYGSAVWKGITYGIWIFKSGEFTNKGDGGWINWAFRGWFDRDGGFVKFKNPPRSRAISILEATFPELILEATSPESISEEVSPKSILEAALFESIPAETFPESIVETTEPVM